MGRFFKHRERGVGHVGVIVAVVVLLVVGGVGWWVWQKNNTPQQKAIKNAECNYEDKDICKFFASWNATDQYTFETSSQQDGQTVTMKIQVDGQDKTHVTFSGDLNYETITIGNALYTKAGDTWYKQTLSAEEVSNYQGDVDADFTEPTEGGKVTYTKVGTEDCGDRECFKYEMVDADQPGVKTYLWFDTKDYLLRRMQVVNADGTTTEMTVTYDSGSISEPSPVKELGENQYIVPGQSEPTTLPDAGDMEMTEEELQNLINQYQ